jgi:hypothetical protein
VRGHLYRAFSCAGTNVSTFIPSLLMPQYKCEDLTFVPRHEKTRDKCEDICTGVFLTAVLMPYTSPATHQSLRKISDAPPGSHLSPLSHILLHCVLYTIILLTPFLHSSIDSPSSSPSLSVSLMQASIRWGARRDSWRTGGAPCGARPPRLGGARRAAEVSSPAWRAARVASVARRHEALWRGGLHDQEV